MNEVHEHSGATEKVYSWRVRLTRGPQRSVYWKAFPAKMTEEEAQEWAREHHATLQRVLGSSGQRSREDLEEEVIEELEDSKGG